MDDESKLVDFLGVGCSFPLRLDTRGQLALVSGANDVREAIRIILLTDKGERVLRPDFGSELYLLEFEPNDAATAGLARRYVMEALGQWEPRIEVLEVFAEPDPADAARLLIEIEYRLVASNSEYNLVFPFYLIPASE